MKKRPKEPKNHTPANITTKILNADIIPYENVYVYNEKRNLLKYYAFPHVLEQRISFTDKNKICLASKKTKFNLKDQLEKNKVYEEEKIDIFRTVVNAVVELEKIGVRNANVKPSNVLYSVRNKIFLSDYLNCELLCLNNDEKIGRIMIGMFFHSVLENSLESYNYNSIYDYVKSVNLKNISLREENKIYESIINKLINNKMTYEEVIMDLENIDYNYDENRNSIYNSDRLVELLKYNNFYYSCFHQLNRRTKRIIDNMLSRVENEGEIVFIEMNLHDIPFYYNELEYLCDNFYFFSNIRKLVLSNNEIDDSGLIYVCNSFRYLPLLEHFDPSTNNITKIGFDSFCSNMYLVSKLKYVYFSKCELTDLCIRQMIKNIHHCPLLIEVSLYGNRIVKKQELCNEMKEKHPNKHLRVIMYQL